MKPIDITLELQRIPTGFQGDFCYTHARAAVAPDGRAVLTTQPLLLSGSDIYYGIETLTSNDGGRTWSALRQEPGLDRRAVSGFPGHVVAMADATPFYHRKTGRFLLTGVSMYYKNDSFIPDPRPRQTAWSVYDAGRGGWKTYRLLDMPQDDCETFFTAAAGCTQIYEEENGDLLIPVYFMNREEARAPWQNSNRATVLRCGFDGDSLVYQSHGNILQLDVPRGICEPSLIRYGGRWFLTMRNDEAGYVSVSHDGLHFEQPRQWCFDDGQPLGNYNTQQHWVECGGRLFLVYTRRGASNDHIFRHRAPLFIAEVDAEKLCVIRSSERIAVPERGARLGNFGCCPVSETESWIVVSEWMQCPEEIGAGNWRYCMQYGSDNSIFIAKVRVADI